MVFKIILKLVILASMFFVTIGALSNLQENGKEVQVSEVVTRKYLSNATCAAIAVITVSYDLISVFLLMRL